MNNNRLGGYPPPPLTKLKISIVHYVVPPLTCPRCVDFVIFMQFLAILHKLSPLKVGQIWENRDM